MHISVQTKRADKRDERAKCFIKQYTEEPPNSVWLWSYLVTGLCALKRIDRLRTLLMTTLGA